MWQALLARFVFPNAGWLAAAIILVPVNLAFEAEKFHHLIRHFSKIHFRQTFKAILGGISVAIFTPNRVGEYGGRLLFVEPGNGWKVVIATLVGSLSQLLTIVTFGIVGTVIFCAEIMKMEMYPLLGLLFLGVLLAALLGFGFFNIDLLVPVARRVPHIEKFSKYLKHLTLLRHYSSRELATVLGFSVCRYATYSLQYLLMLQFFHIPAPLPTGLSCIAAIFLVQASIPLPPVAGLLARGEIALFVWGYFSDDKAGILAASFSLFVINIAMPSLLGLLFIVQTNILKSLGYENGERA